MRMFCFSFYMTNFLNCVQSGGQGHRKEVGQNASQNVLFSYSRLYLATHCSSNVIVPGVCWSFVTMPFKNNYNTSPKYLKFQGQGHFRRKNYGS